MGGAITRAFLAYATKTGSHSLDLVDRMVFLQGAQQGSYLLTVDSATRDAPIIGAAVRTIEAKVERDLELDVTRPPATQLRPQSDLYTYVNQLDNVPNTIDYTNVASDIHLVVAVGLGPVAIPVPVPTVGDYVMLPGSDDPAATPPLGGARFVPAVADRGRSSVQWILSRTDLAVLDPPFIRLPDLQAEPETHVGLVQADATDQIDVTSAGVTGRLTDALLDRILGEGRPQ